MYVQDLYRSQNWETAKEIINNYPLATVVTSHDNRPFANHLPLFLDKHRSSENGLIFGHMARANLQISHLKASSEALLIFHGPQGYISSRWYKNKPNAPTWNYVTVHLKAHCSFLNDPKDILSILRETSARLEPKSEAHEVWAKDLAPNDWVDKMVQQIVGVQFEIQGFECGLKLGQNKDRADLQGAIAGLRKQSKRLPDIADWMERENGR